VGVGGNAGYSGHLNHSLFWQMLCPPKDWVPPDGELLQAIDADFGSLEAMQAKFAAASVGVQGSGWGVRASSPFPEPWRLFLSIGSARVLVADPRRQAWCKRG
jgi:hypothetical protein